MLQHLAKGHAIVLRRVEHFTACAGNHALAGFVGNAGETQRQELHAMSHQVRQVARNLRRRRRADDKITLPAEPLCESAESRERHMVGRHLPFGAELVQPRREFRRHIAMRHRRGILRRAAARAVGGKRERRGHGSELLFPVSKLLRVLGVFAALCFLCRIGGIRCRRAGGTTFFIQSAELLYDDPERPAVADDVVRRQDQRGAAALDCVRLVAAFGCGNLLPGLRVRSLYVIPIRAIPTMEAVSVEVSVLPATSRRRRKLQRVGAVQGGCAAGQSRSQHRADAEIEGLEKILLAEGGGFTTHHAQWPLCLRRDAHGHTVSAETSAQSVVSRGDGLQHARHFLRIHRAGELECQAFVTRQ